MKAFFEAKSQNNRVFWIFFTGIKSGVIYDFFLWTHILDKSYFMEIRKPQE